MILYTNNLKRQLDPIFGLNMHCIYDDVIAWHVFIHSETNDDDYVLYDYDVETKKDEAIAYFKNVNPSFVNSNNKLIVSWIDTNLDTEDFFMTYLNQDVFVIG